MASFREDKIAVNIILVRDPSDGTDHAFLRAATYDSAQNVQVRSLPREDVTHLMSAARMAGITSLLNDAVALLKQRFDINELAPLAITVAPDPKA